MADYDEIRQTLENQYALSVDSETFGKCSLRIHRIVNPDELLDDERVLSASHEEMEWHPYWVHSGAAATGLAHWLGGLSLDGVCVLDLGCGLGVTTAVIAAAGAVVTACDHAPPALEFPRLNTDPFRERVDVRQFDWRHDVLDDTFELIVGSDILYNRADLPHLLKIFERNLRQGGAILLGDPARPLTNNLLKQIPEQGWTVTRREFTTAVGEARIVIVWRGDLSPLSRSWIEM